MTFRAAVAGASGYAGGEVLRLLAGHANIEVATVTAASSAGQKLGAFHPHIPSLADLTIKDTNANMLSGHDLVFLALPHGHSAAISSQLESLSSGSVIVDLAADHRLTDANQWEHYYGGEFCPAWTYGMPELLHVGENYAKAQRNELKNTDRIAVPGCNVTAVTLAIQPAVARGLIDTRHICATLAVGYSGAGRALKPHLLASQAFSNMAPYGAGGTHRHIPEIIQNLSKAGGGQIGLTFTPVLVPTSRGILATVVAPLEDNVSCEHIEAAYSTYLREPLITVLPKGQYPNTGPLTGTGMVSISTSIDERAGTLTAIAAIDNLGKGTAAAAVQSANLALGLEELTAVPMIGVAP
ncbi:N-acetyl-gamma-glutamyl-phosphate reductase [Schaalia vaccimaxillae]|uniref:N-acetyl-gamma-glutamyl-phosphate reductase n=1 Tax=Schaalia vaccimaxillae TaxID=183916 RepID=UPI0003B6A0C6|nr:N-acetyl-gamma-glutamyl-phosphate reductase [Schaalia vaccimaxillae]